LTVPVAIRSSLDSALDGFLSDVGRDKPSEQAIIVRPSSYNSWALCGYRVLYSSDPGFDNTSSEAMAWGSGLHKLVNNHIVWSDVADLTTTPEQALLIWAQEMASRKPSEDIFSYAGKSYLWTKAAEMIRAYELWVERFWLPLGRSLKVVAVEATTLKPLGMIGDRDVWVQGTADFVTEGRVWDWKTAGRGWKKGKAEASAVQPLVYSWLVDDQTPVEEATFVVYNRQDSTWTWDDTSFGVTEQLVTQALRSMWDMARSIDAGIAVATPMTTGGFGDGRSWACSAKYCGAWNICDYRFLIPDGKANQVRGAQSWV
jgi:hypothetical protein